MNSTTKFSERRCDVCWINIDWRPSIAIICASQRCKAEHKSRKRRETDAKKDFVTLRANKERRRIYGKRWRLDNKEKLKEYAKRWLSKKKNKDKMRAWGREQYYKNRERQLAQSKAYYANNREKCKELRRQWELKRTAAMKAMRELELI